MGNWTYNVTQITTSKKDQVRLLIGDVVSTDPQMQDEEINFIISTRGSVWGAAADCCLSLASKFSRSVDQAAGQAKTAYSQMAKAYSLRAANYAARAAQMGSGLPYAGGISVFDVMTQLENSDRVPPSFTVGITDNWLPVAPVGGETEELSSMTPDLEPP